jgi:uncharacterized protein YdcH (DUF465 family)
MTRDEWLANKHRELDKVIWQIKENSSNHDLLRDLKKQKLALKTEIEIAKKT